MRQTPDPCARRGRRPFDIFDDAGIYNPVPGALSGAGQISYLSWPRSPGHDSCSAISSFPSTTSRKTSSQLRADGGCDEIFTHALPLYQSVPLYGA